MYQENILSNHYKIAIIGTGHLGRAIFTGLINGGKVSIGDFILTNHHLNSIIDLRSKYGVDTTSDNKKAFRIADIIVLSVKPNDLKTVIGELRGLTADGKIIVSTAACITIRILEKFFRKPNLKIIRIIPNIPIAINKGVIGILENKNIHQDDRLIFRNLLSSLGLTVYCKSDDQLEKLSLISGCGVGYVSYFIDSLSRLAHKFGFDMKTSLSLALTTYSGTVKYLVSTKKTPTDLSESVATKGGITEEIIGTLKSGGFDRLLSKSLEKGYIKVNKISQRLNKEVNNGHL